MKLFTCPKCGHTEETKNLQVGEIILGDNKVFKNNKEIVLTPTEYALLQYLMVNKNQIKSQGDIFDEVFWGFFDSDADYAFHRVNVYVGYLRKKIGFDAIKNVRGVGYCMEDHQ